MATMPTPPPQVDRSDERRLVDGLRAGDEGVLAELMDRHGEDLMRYLLSLLLRREEAEDIFQETWVRVLRRGRSCDPGRPFAPWLFRVARNLAFDHLRWRRRWRALVGHEPSRPADEPAVAPRTLERLASADLTRRLIGALSPKLREVVHLRFWGDCSYEEIAAIAGVPVGTVKSRMNRALAQLSAGAARLEFCHATATRV